jgi:multidrug efflux pump subunit AcrA (membrane-fusion protein)
MRILILVSIFLLTSCQNEPDSSLVYRVTKESFSVDIPAKGHLFAAQATIISVPQTDSGVNNISWLAPEFSAVAKGDVIARFDDEAIRTKSRSERHLLAMTQQDFIEKKGALSQELNNINNDISIVGQEKIFAERYSIDDERIFSKLDIINAMQNTSYLNSKQDYLLWKNESFNESSSGEINLLEMKRNQSQNKINRLDSNLNHLEIKAPHDGLLVFEANWRGEKPKVGQLAWSGQTLARLPNTDNMKAKLFVAEQEAIALGVGQPVSLELLAYADQPVTGSVESIAPFPKSIRSKDPQQYFEIIVHLDVQNTQLFAPGLKLQASISVAAPQEKIIIPAQSLFTEDNKFYVYLYKNKRYEIAEVSLGKRNLSHVEITSGLSIGQKISLIDQAGS